MITRIQRIDTIKPICREYLEYISRFFDIAHYDMWCENALKQLQRYAGADDQHISYVLKTSDTIIGFALVNQHLRFNRDGFAVAEFYIQKNHWGKGYGRKLAQHLFEEFKGNWEVAVTSKNTSALAFWKQVVSSYSKGDFLTKKKESFNGYGFVFNKKAGEKRLGRKGNCP